MVTTGIDSYYNERPSSSSSSSQRQRYIRIKETSPPNNQRRLELQTCVARFSKLLPNGNTTFVDLHSQVHFGTSDYFQYYNTPSFSSLYDRVHYELIVSDSLLHPFESNPLQRRLVAPRYGLMPSASDSAIARQHSLSCQIDIVDFTQPNWIHADHSREELDALRPHSTATTTSSFPGGDLLQALLQPASPSPTAARQTRLFSNLFLAGRGLAASVRSTLWMTTPAPELFIGLLDWSSLEKPRPGGLSPIAPAVVECLLTGRVREARTLVFGQMIASGQVDDGRGSVVVGGRNRRAMVALEESLVEGCERNALIYGGLHCRDLERRLKRRGYVMTDTFWRTAWAVDLPMRREGEGRWVWVMMAMLGVGYLGVSGLDWVEMLTGMTRALERGDGWEGFEVGLLYVIRHVAIYLGLAKFVVEWDGTLFGGDK